MLSLWLRSQEHYAWSLSPGSVTPTDYTLSNSSSNPSQPGLLTTSYPVRSNGYFYFVNSVLFKV